MRAFVIAWQDACGYTERVCRPFTAYPIASSRNHTGLASKAWRVSACKVSSTMTKAKNARHT